ncbi:Flp pilus assembly protein protease CpaA [Pedobacter sp. AK017]|nr:Flp pilus assembly protein protease CpaA [Pedobacter sp. AK017]
MFSIILIRLLLLLILLVMGIQDMKFRAISWYLFPVLAIVLLLLNPSLSLQNCLLNIGFVAFVLVLLTAWFSLKQGSMVNLTRRHLGMGDILFLLCLALFFSPVDFFLFYLFSLLLICMGTGAYLLLRRPANFTIPLAGLQGFVLILLLLASWIWKTAPGNGDFLPDLLSNVYERG